MAQSKSMLWIDDFHCKHLFILSKYPQVLEQNIPTYLNYAYQDKNKIEGPPILKLAMVQRLCIGQKIRQKICHMYIRNKKKLKETKEPSKDNQKNPNCNNNTNLGSKKLR